MKDPNQLIFISIPADALFTTGDGSPFHETERAYGFAFTAKVTWVPKSKVRQFERNFDRHTLEFWLPRWLVEKKELEKYKDTSFEPSLFDLIEEQKEQEVF